MERSDKNGSGSAGKVADGVTESLKAHDTLRFPGASSVDFRLFSLAYRVFFNTFVHARLVMFVLIVHLSAIRQVSAVLAVYVSL